MIQYHSFRAAFDHITGTNLLILLILYQVLYFFPFYLFSSLLNKQIVRKCIVISILRICFSQLGKTLRTSAGNAENQTLL